MEGLQALPALYRPSIVACNDQRCGLSDCVQGTVHVLVREWGINNFQARPTVSGFQVWLILTVNDTQPG